MAEIKTCPFCGGKVEFMNLFTPVKMFYCTNHRFCGAVVSFDNPYCNNNKDEPKIAAWNRRAETEVVYNGEWTPIKSGKLPDEGEHVLLTVDDVLFTSAGLQVCEAWLKRGIWQTATKEGVFRIIYPLAWKPKPPKYEEVEK